MGPYLGHPRSICAVTLGILLGCSARREDGSAGNAEGSPTTTAASQPPPVTHDGHMTVVVLYFDNNTPDSSYDVLRKGLADMLVTDLAQVRQIRVVERAKLDQLIARAADLLEALLEEEDAVGEGGLAAGVPLGEGGTLVEAEERVVGRSAVVGELVRRRVVLDGDDDVIQE